MRRLALCLFMLGLVGMAKEPAVSIRLSRTVVMANTDQSIFIFCRVQKNPRNRWLEYGIDNFAPGTLRQMNGENAPVYYQLPDSGRPYQFIPCDAGDAYCAVHRDDGSYVVARAPIDVSGCSDSHR